MGPSPETAEQFNTTVNRKWPGQGRSKCPTVSGEQFRAAKRNLTQIKHSVSLPNSWYLKFKCPLCHSRYSMCPYRHVPRNVATSPRAPKCSWKQMFVVIS